MPKIVLLVGRKGSGKDTFAKLLSAHCYGDKEVHLRSFAAPIKDTLVTLFGFPNDSYFNDQDKKERIWPDYCKTHTPRDLMVWFGTDVIRKTFGANFWVDRLKSDLRKLRDDEVVIVTDTRFPNEVSEIVEEFGLDVTAVYIDSCGRLGELDHSKAAIPEIAVINTRDVLISMKDRSTLNIHMIDNNGTLERLNNAAANLAEYINKI